MEKLIYGSHRLMKAIIQRVDEAKVTVNSQTIGRISKGVVLFLGISNNDTTGSIEKLANKIINLRIFEDKQHKMNLSLQNIKGSILIISQFTLYANCKKGNRPSFLEAGEPIYAEKIYNEFVNYINSKKNIRVQTGLFGKTMNVSLVNNGPATFILETNE